MYWFILYNLNLCISSPLRSVHHWLQTNLKHLILNAKQVVWDVMSWRRNLNLSSSST
ncbi:unnamed protein product [Brassica rapa subsp. trilocularis]